MNILIITTHLNIGGIARYVINLAKGLSEKHNVVIASYKGFWQKKLEGTSCTFLPIPLNTKSIISLKILKSFFILKDYLSSHKIDLIHANTRVSQCLAFLIWKFLKVPYVSTFHGYYRPRIFRRLFKFEGLRTISISRSVRRHLISALGIEASKIDVVYHGLDTSEIPSVSKKKMLEKFSIRGFPLIGVVSRLAQEKNHKVLIQAYSFLIKDFPKSKLLIAGRGRLEKSLKNMVKEKKLEKNVIFLGNRNNWEVLSILDVFVFPSIDEGFGFSLIEAQYMGVPVVVLDSGSFKELVKDQYTGMLVKRDTGYEFYRATKKILENASLRKEIVACARESVEQNFLLGLMIENTEKVYKKLLDTRCEYV